jgi:hypothetical protein
LIIITLQNSLDGLIEYDSISKSDIHRMIENSSALNQIYFETTSSIKIGDKTNKVYNIYGKPKEQIANTDGYEKLKWFNDSLKQELIIYSKNEVISGVMIKNKAFYDN